MQNYISDSEIIKLSKNFGSRVIQIKRPDLSPFSAKARLALFFKIKRGEQLDYPRQFWIEITNECNLKCIMCPISNGLKRKKMTMGMEAFVRIIDQIYMVKPRVVLHVAGEPMLNNSLCDMIKYAKNKGCSVGMNTNATLLTKEMSEKILESKLDSISFSFDGFTAEVYEKIRVGAKFNLVKSQIESFLDMVSKRKDNNLFTQIQIIVLKETRGQLFDFLAYWLGKKIDQVTFKFPGDWLGLINTVPEDRRKTFGHRFCRCIFHKCTILVDGTVVSCCADIEGRLPLGNILEKSFNEIWNGETYNCLRKKHLENNIPRNIICYGCIGRYSWSKFEQIAEWLLGNIFWRHHLFESKRHRIYE